LHGLLAKISNLGLPWLLVRRVKVPQREEHHEQEDTPH